MSIVHWSTRTLAEHMSLSATTIRRVWQRNDIKPHLVCSFQLPSDPRFEDKVLDGIGTVPEPTRAYAGTQLR
jgi:hypothetical protein